MAQREPQPEDMCQDEAGVIWYVAEVTDDLVYAMTGTENPNDVETAIDAEYDAMATAETAAGGDPGRFSGCGCWLKEDWAALPAVAA